MDSFNCKLCQEIGQRDPEKYNSVCIYCRNVSLMQELNDLQIKKSKQLHLQKKEKTDLLLKRKFAKLKGLEISKDITPEFEIPVKKY